MNRYLVIAILLVGCGKPESPASGADPAPHALAEESQPMAVPVRPIEGAQQLGPNLYFVRLRAPNPNARAIEEDWPFLSIQTSYDKAGLEFSTSVPSRKWSLVSEASRAAFRGMKAGEQRRVWDCMETATGPCKVSDIQILEMTGQGRPN